MLERIQIDAAGKNVSRRPFHPRPRSYVPSPFSNGLVRRMLQVEIEGGVHLEARGMDFLRAETALQLAAHFFDEPWSNATVGRLDVEAQRRGGRFGLSAVILPSSSIESMTTLRRRKARSGLLIGENS